MLYDKTYNIMNGKQLKNSISSLFLHYLFNCLDSDNIVVF